jgi:oxazoline/thiazoline synthase
VILESRPKRFTADGGHRVATPEETIKTYAKHISPITGAVSVLGKGEGNDEGLLNVYVAGHNLAQRPTNLHFLRQGLRSKSAGKGMSDAQARASGLCEAIERYNGVFQGDEPRRLASYDELGDEAIHPQTLVQYSEHQYQERDRWNSTGTGFSAVSHPFDTSRTIDWSSVWSLTRRQFRYVPTSHLYFSYPIDHDTFTCWADSNGNAAGNTLEEAILQGFFELVERDAVALWWYNRVRRPAVDLDSFDEPYIGRLRDFYRRHGRDSWVLDLTSDFGIPVYAAVSRRTDKPAEDILFAFGAHFDPRIALLRALTEMNQFLPAVLEMPADGSGEYRFHDVVARQWWQHGKLAEQSYLAPSEDLPATAAASVPRVWTDDIRDDVELCRRLVEERGMEMLVLDQTQPDIGLPVAKVIVPGMRHFWARFAPGRLYEVPVQLGWLPKPLAEEELNPIPMFI